MLHFKLNNNMKITKLVENKITFDNGSVLCFLHDQQCCENVWADCENIQAMNGINDPIYEAEFDETLPFELVEEIGICIINKSGMKYLISCYNQQNGYYSDELECYLFSAKQYEYAVLKDWFLEDWISGETFDNIWHIRNVTKKDDIN